MIRVLVVDDHAIFRRGLRTILDEAGDMEVGCEAGSGAEAIDRLRGCRCDIAVLDIAMPDRSGIEVLDHIKAWRPDMPVLVLSVYPEDQYAMRLIKMGAAGYMNKESAPTQLLDALRRIASGKRYISPALAEQLAEEQVAGGDLPPHETLSNREYQVFARLVSGASVSEIAEAMSLSVKTVSTYRARVLDKLRLKGNAELVRYALQHGLTEL